MAPFTTQYSGEWPASFTPDGKYLLFISDRPGGNIPGVSITQFLTGINDEIPNNSLRPLSS